MGRNLSLRTRRLLARGISPYNARKWAGAYFLSAGIGNRATLTTALAGANNDLSLYAKAPGTGGNAITFRIVVAGASTPLSVSLAGNAITVNSATNAGSTAISTAADVRKALNFSTTIGPLVHVQNAPASDGTGAVVALSVTSLAGGS